MSFLSLHVPGAQAADLADALFRDESEGLALLDRAGAVVRANACFGRLLPVPPGRQVWDVLPAQCAPALEAAMHGGRAASLTATLGDGGHGVVLRLSLLPVRHRFGLLRVADRTEAQAREDQLGQAQRLQLVGELAGRIAHDFNNLLTAILGSADDLDSRAESETDRAELRQIRESAGRGAALVRQLLAHSRQQTLQPRVISLNAAVREAAGLLQRLVAPQVAMKLQLEEPDRMVRIDPTQLDQVLINLAVNASHAMPDGGTLTIASRPRVVIRPEKMGGDWVPKGRYALLRVADTGTGIPPDLLARIFEPFFTTRQDSGGTGLGLSTVHGIVHQSGGFMGVHSVPGQGTAFEILLPRYEEDWLRTADPGEAPPAFVPAPATAPATERLLLLVDDEAPVRRLAERALRREGFAVLCAASAEEALEKLAADTELAGVISDVQMPGMDGTALVRRLREDRPGLPACLMSGYADVAVRDGLAAADIVFLPKPFGVKELVLAARRLEAGLAGEGASF
jgi:two-component system cell cycle sensor histidine kinase/response regulator CckA